MAPCLPCCNVAPEPPDCACSLQAGYDWVGAYSDYSVYLPMADYATAKTAMDSFSANCISFTNYYGEFPGSGTPPSVFTADDSVPNEVAWDFQSSNDNGVLYLCVCLKAGCTTTINYSISGGDTVFVDAFVLSCDYNGIVGWYSNRQSVEFSGMLTFDAIPSDGIYIIQFGANLGGTEDSINISATVSFDDDSVINPVIALYDSGVPETPYILEACPKLQLPTLTEITGTWYADLLTAEAVLASANVSNCVGYIDSLTGISSFEATDGGSSLTLAVTAIESAGTNTMWGSVNALASETLTFTFTTDAGTPSANVNIYNARGVLIETLSGSSPLVSSALPYSGRYTLSVEIINAPPEDPFNTASVEVTSSDTLSVNGIQALYDSGFTCASRIDCTP